MLQAEVRIPQSLARHARTRGICTGGQPRTSRPRAGDCYQISTTGGDELTIVSCNQPHDAETFHAFEFRGDQFPTDDELDQASDEICGLMFEYYVGKPVADSTLDYQWVGPDENVWAQGDHIVECYAFAKDGSKLNRSIWNSNM